MLKTISCFFQKGLLNLSSEIYIADNIKEQHAMDDTEKEKLVKHRFTKALKTIDLVDFLIRNKMWNVAQERIYFSCYYAVNSLLANINVNAKSDETTMLLFNQHFIKTNIIEKETGYFFHQLLDMKRKIEYVDFVEYKEDDIVPLIQPAKDMITKIGTFLP